jgi:hypothetical protein
MHVRPRDGEYAGTTQLVADVPSGNFIDDAVVTITAKADADPKTV